MEAAHNPLTGFQQFSLVVKVLAWVFVCWLVIVLIAATKEGKEESIKNGKGIDQILKRMESKSSPVIIVGDNPPAIQEIPSAEKKP